MLPKQYRLKKRSAFQATYKVKNSTHSGGVTLFAGKLKTAIKQDNEGSIFTPPTKVGFVVSKKVHKRAVKRNRLKRLMRESYRLLLKDGNLGNSQKYVSLIFVGSGRALGKDFDYIKTNIKKMLERI
jgi:ribonuclease P protein component